MARYLATAPVAFAEMWPVVDDVAQAQGWGVHLTSTKHDRVYSKSAGWTSWGVTLKVRLEDGGGFTRFNFDVSAFSLMDRRRARKDVEKLVAALGGTLDS